MPPFPAIPTLTAQELREHKAQVLHPSKQPWGSCLPFPQGLVAQGSLGSEPCSECQGRSLPSLVLVSLLCGARQWHTMGQCLVLHWVAPASPRCNFLVRGHQASGWVRWWSRNQTGRAQDTPVWTQAGRSTLTESLAGAGCDTHTRCPLWGVTQTVAQRPAPASPAVRDTP